jgi:diguanylate cyclase (GGDEF)-like protein/PAS domain S-box-containing protein
LLSAAGSENVLLLCAALLLTVLVSSLFKGRLGITAGILSGIVFGFAAALASAFFFDAELYSITNIIIPACLGFAGFVNSYSASRRRAQQSTISEQKAQLAELNRELSRYVNSQNHSNKDDIFNRKVLEKLRNGDPDVSKLLWLTVNELLESSEPSEKCLEIILALDPSFFAYLKTDGSIIAYNPTLLAIYGYTGKDNLTGKNILDLIHENEVEDLSTDLKYLRFRDDYSVRTRNEQYIEDVAYPPISLSFDRSRNPYLILARINTRTRSIKKADAVLELTKQGIWWIDSRGETKFITESTAKLLGYSANEIAGKKITDCLKYGQAGKFNELLGFCRDGANRTQRFEFFQKNGDTAAMQVNTYAILDGSRNLLGLLLTLENISKQSFAERSLSYRLSMEEMITNISSRFVGISSNNVDFEIVNSLNLIEEFMGVRDSFLQLSLSPDGESDAPLLGEMTWNSSNSRSRLNQGGLRLYESPEIIAIPIVSGGKQIGSFRCTRNTYSKEWMGEDIQLIQLVGEIFINALTGREFQRKLILSEERLRVTLNSIGDAVIAVDENKTIQMFNKAAESIIGISRNEALYKHLDEVFVTKQVIESQGLSNEKVYTALVRKDENDVYISVRRSLIQDSEKNIFGEVIIFSDITEEKLAEDEIRYLSFHDRLTNLYNRAYFEEEMRRLDVKRQYPITIIMGDCNGLKITNDVFGHYEGDRLLIRTAEILLKATRKEDIVARWGGDEFVIILPRTDEKTANEIRERILDACQSSDMHPIKPSLALGSATKTDERERIEDVLKDAEERMYRHKLLEGRSTRNSIISSFEKMLYERNFETEEHAKRMQQMAKKFGLALGLSDHELDNLCLLAALHDIGKIGIPDYILLKQGLLSNEEWKHMKKHPEIGFSIANATNELKNIADLILHHHERWDGTGYPEGLKGEEIPKLSRILSIIDAYDVITHSRPYKEPLTKKEALNEISHCAGTQFDPKLVKQFVRMMRNWDEEPPVDARLAAGSNTI